MSVGEKWREYRYQHNQKKSLRQRAFVVSAKRSWNLDQSSVLSVGQKYYEMKPDLKKAEGESALPTFNGQNFLDIHDIVSYTFPDKKEVLTKGKRMPNIQFFALAESVCNKFNLPPIPFPVRPGHEKEIFKPQGVALDLLLDELENYLIEHPEERVFFKEAGSRLASLEGIRLGQEGFHDLAAHYFELGLALDPENLSLRSNYALALQSAGRKEEAMRQYRFLLQQPAISIQPLIWILAARLFLDSGDPVTAYQILKHCASFMPVDNEFWELFAEARERAGIKPWIAPGQKKVEAKAKLAPSLAPEEKEKVSAKKNFCPACGKPIKSDAKFCGSCGHAL